jgi:three-Cys-motif partner protein
MLPGKTVMKLELPDPTPDGLLIPDVKAHSRQKHHYLRRYLHAFTTSMREKWEIHYIDLFCGAGIENVEGYGLDWGSPLLAAQMPKQFRRIHGTELNRDKYDALLSRIAHFDQPMPPNLHHGDANQLCNQIVGRIPQHGTLSLAFLDPYGLHLDFDTVRRLSTLSHIDLIIFFPDHLDALRNWQMNYLANENSNLDKFLGTPEWRASLLDSNVTQHAEILRNIYEDQLRELGFVFLDYKRITRSDNRPLYRLIFASREETGLKIWSNTSLVDFGGQSSLPW